MMSMTLELDFQNPFEYTNIPTVVEFQQWANIGLQRNSKHNQTNSVVIRITNEAESQQLNFDYRQKNSTTNVLSFPFEMPDLPDQSESDHLAFHLGDLIFCEPVITNEAKQQNKTLQQHWAHLVIHGMLHLQGYDHINDDDAKRMESLEIKLLQHLGFANPYNPNDNTTTPPTHNAK